MDQSSGSGARFGVEVNGRRRKGWTVLKLLTCEHDYHFDDGQEQNSLRTLVRPESTSG